MSCHNLPFVHIPHRSDRQLGNYPAIMTVFWTTVAGLPVCLAFCLAGYFNLSTCFFFFCQRRSLQDSTAIMYSPSLSPSKAKVVTCHTQHPRDGIVHRLLPVFVTPAPFIHRPSRSRLSFERTRRLICIYSSPKLKLGDSRLPNCFSRRVAYRAVTPRPVTQVGPWRRGAVNNRSPVSPREYLASLMSQFSRTAIIREMKSLMCEQI